MHHTVCTSAGMAACGPSKLETTSFQLLAAMQTCAADLIVCFVKKQLSAYLIKYIHKSISNRTCTNCSCLLNMVFMVQSDILENGKNQKIASALSASLIFLHQKHIFFHALKTLLCTHWQKVLLMQVYPQFFLMELFDMEHVYGP